MRHLAARYIMLMVAVSGTLSAQVVITAVLNSASFSAATSPGSWITIFGSNLAPSFASSSQLPATLNGVTLTVGGKTALLSYVSSNQVNAFVQFETAIPTNTVVPLVLRNASASATYNVRLTRNAPGIFTENGAGTGRAIFSNQDGLSTVIGGHDYAFYATGLGPEDSSGRLTDTLDVYLGEHKAQVTSAAAIPRLPGVYQIQVTAPLSLASDRLYLSSGSWQSNIVDVPVQPGSNATNVSGAIDGLYPSSDQFFTLPICTSDEPDAPPCGSGQDLGVMLHAGSFSVAFDITSGAGLFEVAAVGEAGGVIISVDPGGRYTASVTVPAAGPKAGNFKDAVAPLWDYSSCAPTTAVCASFPANLIPPSRLSPLWLQATQSLPAETTASNGPNTTIQLSGSITGSHFAIDAQNNAGLRKFGGFVQVPYGPFDQLASTFKLYVDGRLIATKRLPYTVVHR